MKRIANILAACVLTAPSLLAFQKEVSSDDVRLYDINLTVDEGAEKVRVRIDMAVDSYNVGSDREIIFTPVLLADNLSDSLQLEPIVIAGRNRWYHYLRDGFLDDGDSNIFRAGKKGKAHIDAEFPFQPWMANSSLEMRAESANCCDAPDRLVGPSPSGNVPLARIDLERPQVDIDFVFAPPVDAGPVIKSIEGSAFVTFVVNRTELKPDYMNNPAELQKIINSIEYVRRDTDATITRVHIKGFASPEGPYQNNVRLAQGRTETLRRYVRDLYSFADSIVTSDYQPEDWAGLRTWITDSLSLPISNRPAILDIIDGPLDYDERNTAIQRQFPQDYAVILRDIYPWLRHSDYKVTYAIKTYTSLEEIARVYAADPTRLRNVDFYTLAQSYPVGSPEYCSVFATAVEIYPDDPMLNLNAANLALEAGDLDRAQSYLLKAGNTPEANYARGILGARRSDYAEAIRRFEAARAAGMSGIDPILERIAAARDYYPVTYLIGTVGK